ncbi:MAG: hypothetical protein RR071_05910 [Lachnospiraceae bacterium]
MKIAKGQPEYLKQKKKRELGITFFEFAIIAGLILVGYTQTGTKLNWFTFAAILGCLPASKQLVSVITIFPYKSIDMPLADELQKKATVVTSLYDLVITSREQIMPIDCMVISNCTICGYTHSFKVDVDATAKYIKDMLASNHLDRISVKIFTDFNAFISRAEGMNNIAMIEKMEPDERTFKIRQIILNNSL